MFIKRETRAGKPYAYRMLLSFKTLVAYNFFLNFTPDNCARCKAVFVGYDLMPDIVRCPVLIFRPDYGKKKGVLSIRSTF